MESQSLRHGLAALETLVQADGPLTATQVAQLIDVHQTTASRILKDLIEAGYARRVSYQQYAPDYGALVMGIQSARHFPLLLKPRLALESAAGMCAGLSVSLAVYWNSRLLYFNQASRDLETRLFEGYGFPLHLSSPGLLFMLAMPEADAIAELKTSRERRGWERPTESVPATETEVLRQARILARKDTLVLREWQDRGHVSAAVVLPDLDGIPLALTLSGPSDVLGDEGLRHRLTQMKEHVLPSIPYGAAHRATSQEGNISAGWA